MMPNFLSPLEFRVSVRRLPNVQFYTQQTSIPSVSTTPVVQPTRFNPIYRVGDAVTYSPLDLMFIIDEDMNNYLEVFNWLTKQSFPQSHNQFEEIRSSQDGIFSDILITILNSKKNSNIDILYKNCFPTNLSDVVLNTVDSDVVYPQATATFQYDSFTIKRFAD
jgi:hypothetical protein